MGDCINICQVSKRLLEVEDDEEGYGSVWGLTDQGDKNRDRNESMRYGGRESSTM